MENEKVSEEIGDTMNKYMEVSELKNTYLKDKAQ